MQDQSTYRTIPLSKGHVALVDAEDYDALSSLKWFAQQYHKTWYAFHIAATHPVRVRVRMHRVIVGAKPDEEVDHVNGNGLDNRRTNLRVATHSQNMRNSRRRSDNTSGFRGASFSRSRDRWQAKIVTEGHAQHLGFFVTMEEAARAYDAAARRLHGEFARLNFPDEGGPLRAVGPGVDSMAFHRVADMLAVKMNEAIYASDYRSAAAYAQVAADAEGRALSRIPTRAVAMYQTLRESQWSFVAKTMELTSRIGGDSRPPDDV